MRNTIIIYLFTTVVYQACCSIDMEKGSQNNLGIDYFAHNPKSLPKRQQDIKHRHKLRMSKCAPNTTKMSKIQIEENNIGNIKRKLLTDGVFKLKLLANVIKQRVEPSLDITDVSANATDKYFHEVLKLFDLKHKKRKTSELDVEYFYLFLVQSASERFKRASLFLRDEIISRTENYLKISEMVELKELVFINIVYEKQNMYRYICESRKICRPFPAYTDRVAELLNDVLKLSNDDMTLKFAIALKEIIAAEKEFFATIMSDDTAFRIQTIVNPFLTVTNITKLFSIISKNITRRYKLLTEEDGEIYNKTKALTIVFDIINKAFDKLGNELVSIEFQYLQQDILEWAAGESDDLIKNIVEDFVRSFIDSVNHQWTDKAKEEVKALIEIIITAATENKSVQDYLLTNGSKFVKYEDSFNDLFIL